MNQDPANCLLTLPPGINIKLFFLNMLNRQKKSFERPIFQMVFAFFKTILVSCFKIKIILLWFDILILF